MVTDSFHGTVFAILFNKQFVTIGNEKRGIGRFKSLLRQFDLEDRMVVNISFPEIMDTLQKKIDYVVVNCKIQELKLKSFTFLQNSMSKAD